MLNYKLSLSGLAIALLMPIVSIAGNEGHGGISVVCRNGGAIQSIELLDMYEAREIHGLNVLASSKPVREQFREVLDKNLVDYPEDAQILLDKTEFYFQKAQPISTGSKLVLTNDAFPIALPIGCQFEQVAVVDTYGTLFVDTNLLKAMSNQNQAALYLHEAIYSLARQNVHATSSISTRKAVGMLFSDRSPGDIIAALSDAGAVSVLDILTTRYFSEIKSKQFLSRLSESGSETINLKEFLCGDNVISDDEYKECKSKGKLFPRLIEATDPRWNNQGNITSTQVTVDQATKILTRREVWVSGTDQFQRTEQFTCLNTLAIINFEGSTPDFEFALACSWYGYALEDNSGRKWNMPRDYQVRSNMIVLGSKNIGYKRLSIVGMNRVLPGNSLGPMIDSTAFEDESRPFLEAK